jgi:tRNA U38,U39,U40 pseudouridine synthase TruA
MAAAAGTAHRYLLKVAYNGSAYSGWQSQSNTGAKTIAGALTGAAQRFIGYGSLGPWGIVGE